MKFCFCLHCLQTAAVDYGSHWYLMSFYGFVDACMFLFWRSDLWESVRGNGPHVTLMGPHWKCPRFNPAWIKCCESEQLGARVGDYSVYFICCRKVEKGPNWVWNTADWIRDSQCTNKCISGATQGGWPVTGSGFSHGCQMLWFFHKRNLKKNTCTYCINVGKLNVTPRKLDYCQNQKQALCSLQSSSPQRKKSTYFKANWFCVMLH